MVKAPQASSPPRTFPASLRLMLDFLPLVVFFVAFKLAGVLPATAALIAATVLSLAITYGVTRRLAPLPLISGLLVAVLGGLSLALNDVDFIKMKPTLVNLVFAGVLLIGVYGFERSLLRHVLDAAFELDEAGWRRLSLRWGWFFLALAGLNELIWRHTSTDFWVDFKVFGVLGLTVLFGLLQWPLIRALGRERA